MGSTWIVIVIIIVFALYIALKKFEDLSGKTEEELKGHFKSDGNRLFWRNALRELKKRGVEIDFAKHDIIELMLSSNIRDRVIGWECFKEVSSKNIAYDPGKPSEEVILELKAIQQLAWEGNVPDKAMGHSDRKYKKNADG